MAVSAGKVEKGIAGDLLAAAMKLLTQKNFHYLFSIVTIGLIFNFPSLKFHENHGFERVAFGLPAAVFDIPNYQSMLYVKTV